MNEIEYLLSLKHIHGIGEITLARLIEKYGSAERVFKAGKSELMKNGGLGNHTAELICSFSEWNKYSKEYENVKRKKYEFLTYSESNYPNNLKNIYNYPLLLQYSGEIRKEDDISLAVVGSRNCDEYGKCITELIVKALVEKRITVVSGMARGIDTVAHTSASKYGGRTIAVMGSGLDVCYPPENMELFKLISRNGYVVTEYLLGTKPDNTNFPKRNRLISGLSLGVLVVQANRKSGALITADYAIEQNREVFAIPANINNKKSIGCNYLIKNGAKLVEKPDDIFSEIRQFRDLEKRLTDGSKTQVESNLSETEKLILKNLKGKRLHIDELIIFSEMPPSDIYPVLLDMEIRGLIRTLPGNYFEPLM